MRGEHLLRLPEVARRYGVSEPTIRRRLAAGDRSIAVPAFDRPWRWRASDVDHHITANTVAAQRKARRDQARTAAADAAIQEAR